jgi:hypothetical protein
VSTPLLLHSRDHAPPDAAGGPLERKPRLSSALKYRRVRTEATPAATWNPSSDDLRRQQLEAVANEPSSSEDNREAAWHDLRLEFST